MSDYKLAPYPRFVTVVEEIDQAALEDDKLTLKVKVDPDSQSGWVDLFIDEKVVKRVEFWGPPPERWITVFFTKAELLSAGNGGHAFSYLQNPSPLYPTDGWPSHKVGIDINLS